MAIALDYQTVYYRRGKRTVPLGWNIAAAVLLFFALAAKVWIKVECTEYGYQLAKVRKETVALDMERRELELHYSVLLKPDNLIMRSKKLLNLGALNPQQARKVVY